MDNLKWCFGQNKGIRFVEPNLNIAKKYISESKNDFYLIKGKEPKWDVIKEYYCCYNAFYSLLVRCGIKCEIHDCSLKLMPFFEFDNFSCDTLIDLKKERIGVQYYLNKSNSDYFEFTKTFLEICEIKFIELNDLQVQRIRNKIKEIFRG